MLRRARIGVLVALLAAAGCGVPTNDRPSGTHGAQAVFVARVDAVCAAAVARHSGYAFPVADFDPEHPGPRALPAVGDYFAAYGGLPATTTGLHRLTPPATQANPWRQLLDIADQMMTNSARQIAAARARDVASFVQTVHTQNA